jgi:hypothetical protein
MRRFAHDVLFGESPKGSPASQELDFPEDVNALPSPTFIPFHHSDSSVSDSYAVSEKNERRRIVVG